MTRTTEKDATRSWWSKAPPSVGGALTTRDDADAPTPGTRGAAAGAVQAPPLDPDAEPRGSLRRYLKFQVKDFLRERGSWMLALGGVGVAWFRAMYDPSWIAHVPRWGHPLTEPQYFLNALIGVFSTTGFVGALIATHGIVSRDRERGHQRFLFAKPVSPWRYYLQSFLVNGAGFVGAIGVLLLATAALFARGVPLFGGMLVATAGYVAIGGLVFLLSTLMRYDFALATVLTIAGTITQAVGRTADRWAPLWAGIGLLLPPLQPLGAAIDAVREGHTLAALASCLPPILYGVVCVLIGLMAIRDRSIAN